MMTAKKIPPATFTPPASIPGEMPLPDMPDLPEEPAPPRLSGKVAPAPKKRPPEPAPDPVKAPNGWVWESNRWRARRAPGRPTNATKGIPTAAPSAGTTSTAENAAKKVRRQSLKDVVEGVALILAAAPIGGDWRVRARLGSAVLNANAKPMAEGAAQIAEHVPILGRYVDKVAAGEGPTWLIPTAMVFAPVITAAFEVLRMPIDDDARRAADFIEQQTAASVRASFEAVMAQARAEADRAAQEMADE